MSLLCSFNTVKVEQIRSVQGLLVIKTYTKKKIVLVLLADGYIEPKWLFTISCHRHMQFGGKHCKQSRLGTGALRWLAGIHMNVENDRHDDH